MRISLKRPVLITFEILPPINICSDKRNHMTGTFLISLLIDDEYQHFQKLSFDDNSFWFQ